MDDEIQKIADSLNENFCIKKSLITGKYHVTFPDADEVYTGDTILEALQDAQKGK